MYVILTWERGHSVIATHMYHCTHMYMYKGAHAGFKRDAVLHNFDSSSV